MIYDLRFTIFGSARFALPRDAAGRRISHAGTRAIPMPHAGTRAIPMPHVGTRVLFF